MLATIQTIRAGTYDPDLLEVARIEKCLVQASVVEQTHRDVQELEPAAQSESDSSLCRNWESLNWKFMIHLGMPKPCKNGKIITFLLPRILLNLHGIHCESSVLEGPN